MNKTVLLIGPNFHHFNQSIKKALEQLDWEVSLCAYDIPDYSVAVGAPAKVIKQYNFETQKWEKK